MLNHSDITKKINRIRIVGSRNLQNLLLARYLNEESGISCDVHNTPPVDMTSAKENKESQLILYDYGDVISPKYPSILPVRTDHPCQVFALFNFPKALGIDTERKAYEEGIRGVFYEDINLNLFKKGIMSICSGELWFSRNALSQFADSKPLAMAKKDEKNVLTEREKDILILISFGLSNKRISERLFISQHTVKTHIYNVYQKINVANRTQASLWASQFLSDIKEQLFIHQ